MSTAARALVLFDIDGTLLHRAGPHHRQALEEAVRRVLGVETTTEGLNTAGKLDPGILAEMLQAAGAWHRDSRRRLPEVMRMAEEIYQETCPDLRDRVCPGTVDALERLHAEKIPAVLVTGNLSAIGWRKMERAGLRPFFRSGAFAEMARTRAGLVRRAVAEARERGWLARGGRVSLIGDHINDIQAAKRARTRSIAVATGVLSADELAPHAPDHLLADLRSLRLEMVL